MTTIAVLPRSTDKLAQRWWRTGGYHARALAASRRRRKPATATLNDSRNHQAEPLLPARRLINRLEALRAPALTLSASAKSP
jgi:hypothetical protein